MKFAIGAWWVGFLTWVGAGCDQEHLGQTPVAWQVAGRRPVSGIRAGISHARGVCSAGHAGMLELSLALLIVSFRRRCRLRETDESCPHHRRRARARRHRLLFAGNTGRWFRAPGQVPGLIEAFGRGRSWAAYRCCRESSNRYRPLRWQALSATALLAAVVPG